MRFNNEKFHESQVCQARGEAARRKIVVFTYQKLFYLIIMFFSFIFFYTEVCCDLGKIVSLICILFIF